MWVAESQYDILGNRFGVRSDDEWVAKTVDSLLMPFVLPRRAAVRSKSMFALASQRPGDNRHHAYRDCRRIARSEAWTNVFDSFLSELNRRAIDDMDHFGVHAGVVAMDSRTIALPASSGAGKSTLVAACLREEFRYLSDEALCLDYTNGLVVPYPKPLNLSQWSLGVLGVEAALQPSSEGAKTPIPPDQMGDLGDPDRALTDVIFAERAPGPPSLEPLPRSEVMAGLLRYSFNHYKRPQDSFALVTQQARRCSGWALRYEEPQAAAALLRSAFG